ncbi:hypothetical protein KP509_10G037000 [Ceratopteris richardii]|nr:hypothetical protein KP509_10G037000 [Ceratopteris richardii]
MAARPRSKALKKMKGQRNKAHSSDVVSNYQMHEWALPRHLLRSTVALAASTTSISSSVNDDNGARDMEPVCLAFLLGNYTDSSQHPGDGHPCRDSPTVQEIVEENEDLDSSSDDWLDLASIDCYSDAGADDEWYLC